MKNDNRAFEQADAQMESIRAMVAALDVDYDHLAELQEAYNAQRSISAGTMRQADLVPVFLAELAEHDRKAADAFLAEIGDDPFNDDGHAFWSTADAVDILESLFDALDRVAPAGCYFGAHPGDGSHYGYWMAEDVADELAELEAAADGCTDRDEARQRIHEDALSVDVRNDWHAPGDEEAPSEFRVLLCTGGPAVQIRGELDQYGAPARAWIEYQDWFTPWVERVNREGDHEALLTYAGCFYFGQ